MSRPAQPGVVRPGRVRRFSAEHPLIVDSALALVLVGLPTIAFAFGPRHDGRKLTATWVIATVVGGALIVMRRRHALILLAIATVAAATLMLIDSTRSVVFFAVFVCALTVASTAARRLAIAAGAVSAATLFAIGGFAVPGGWLAGENISTVAWIGMAVAAGDAARSRREYIAAVVERAIRAEHGREQEARRQVAEERLRIARELHDVVAHHMAMITVQSGVAAHLMRSQPDQAEQALTIVRESGRSVLKEMTGMLNVLRRPEDPDDPLEPLPDLHQLGDLIESFAAAGLHVEWRTVGAPAAMDASVQLTVYRVIQESLTNAHKYGDGNVVLYLTYTPEAVAIDVENRVVRRTTERADAPTSTGLGIIGMRERVAALGGTISIASRDHDAFGVAVSIPVAGGDR